MKPMLMRLAVLAVVGLMCAVPFAVRAEDEDGDHDRARDLYERGEIEGLADILATVRDRVPGEIVAVNLVRLRGKWAYRLQVVGPDGRRRIVDVDARPGATMHIDGDPR
ncbi:hypothetical protein FJ987_11810 [Mesorhizobium sp. CU2]|uniref:PepSY domain-containing protein n=1 Tax=unclassified Mesorhizobium TaxID=325217 RepID=UPI00112DF3EF|nr:MULTISPECIES: PepSY domain-containing protein [unclassified Mesorhizobium]TPN83232.1 hypothetical protein FJ988_14620 [Mesorhizobium sp. CU3]TPO15892.1 hypothetical protein FJ987_11810 [Mesorhizobium sp. CU2]